MARPGRYYERAGEARRLRSRLLPPVLAAPVVVFAAAAAGAPLLVLAVIAAASGAAALLVADRLAARPMRRLERELDETRDALETRGREIDRWTGERQRLLAELLAAEEEERKRIASDIHDDSIQALGALLLRLELLESRLDAEEHRQALAEAREAAREAVGRLRHLLFKLSPPALETDGLAAALRAYADEITRVWGPATLVESLLADEPSPEVGALVYRITIEAVGNAAKHARARRIDITLAQRDRGLRVRVADDGVGFDPADTASAQLGHLGLASMRERAEYAGGWWRLETAVGEGTAVEFWVPDRYSSSPRRIASATAAARSDTPSLS